MNDGVLRVGMITQSYYPRIGGAERQLASIVPILQSSGVEVTILTRRYPEMAAYEVINNVPVYRLPAIGPKPIASLMFTSSSLPVLYKIKPHLVHAHELLSPATTAIVYKQFSRAPIIAKVLRGGILGDLAKVKQKPFNRVRLRFIIENIDIFLTISHEIEAELAGIGVPDHKQIYLPNGVDTDYYKPLSLEEKMARKKSLGLEGKKVVVYTGRLMKEKRLDLLISIWQAVLARYHEAELFIIGSGEEETHLKKMPCSGIKFIGPVSDVLPYLHAADLFVLPSVTEGLSNSMLEAMSCGVPVIATAVGGAVDVIDHGINGWLVPPEDTSALEGSILFLLDNQTLCDLISEKCREKIVNHYSLHTQAIKLFSIYQSMVSLSKKSLPYQK